MLKLITWPTSPFGAKVKLALAALNLLDRTTIEHYHPWQCGDAFRSMNPLKKIPVLLTKDGAPLYDSPVICDYVNSVRDDFSAFTLFPTQYYYEILRIQALCDGILDAGVSIRYETHFRPKNLQSRDWITRQRKAIEHGGHTLTHHLKTGYWKSLSVEPNSFNLAQICVLVTLAYLDVRYPDLIAQNSWDDLRNYKDTILQCYPWAKDHLPRDHLPLPTDLERLAA